MLSLPSCPCNEHSEFGQKRSLIDLRRIDGPRGESCSCQNGRQAYPPKGFDARRQQLTTETPSEAYVGGIRHIAFYGYESRIGGVGYELCRDLRNLAYMTETVEWRWSGTETRGRVL